MPKRILNTFLISVVKSKLDTAAEYKPEALPKLISIKMIPWFFNHAYSFTKAVHLTTSLVIFFYDLLKAY